MEDNKALKRDKRIDRLVYAVIIVFQFIKPIISAISAFFTGVYAFFAASVTFITGTFIAFAIYKFIPYFLVAVVLLLYRVGYFIPPLKYQLMMRDYEVHVTVHIDDFQTVADKMISVYGQEKERNPDLDSMHIDFCPGKELQLSCRDDKDKTYSVTYSVSEEEQKAFKNVYALFLYDNDGRHLYLISVDDRCVKFITTYSYRVYYSIDGRKPEIVSNADYYIERLSKGWYQVVFD